VAVIPVVKNGFNGGEKWGKIYSSTKQVISLKVNRNEKLMEKIDKCYHNDNWLNCNIKKKLRGLNSRANYTDRVTAAVGEVSANFCG
jgi:hypothetical protein